MLKRKLNKNIAAQNAIANGKQESENDIKVSKIRTEDAVVAISSHFVEPLWKSFYDIEVNLNKEIAELKPPGNITHIYNPIEYAAEIHCAYLRRYLNGPKKLVFVGMNPGPNGMGQTGVPFGNVGTVRDTMKLEGNVAQPPKVHAKRPVKGLQCTIEEPSGVRIWGVFERLADGLENFSQQCFVHNFCPLAFFDKNGKNITPNELKGDYKTEVRSVCLKALNQLLLLLQPEIVVAVGDYVFTTLKKVENIKVLKIPHPSPRSLNNTNWPEKAEKWLSDNDLMGFIKNDVTQ